MSSEDKEYPSIPASYLIIHSNLFTNLNLMKQELNWFLEQDRKRFIRSKDFDRDWQNFAERIRELLFIAKQSMTAEQFTRFRALVKMTFGTGYTTKLRRLLKQTPKEFLNFDEATL